MRLKWRLFSITTGFALIHDAITAGLHRLIADCHLTGAHLTCSYHTDVHLTGSYLTCSYLTGSARVFLF